MNFETTIRCSTWVVVRKITVTVQAGFWIKFLLKQNVTHYDHTIEEIYLINKLILFQA